MKTNEITKISKEIQKILAKNGIKIDYLTVEEFVKQCIKIRNKISRENGLL